MKEIIAKINRELSKKIILCVEAEEWYKAGVEENKSQLSEGLIK